MPTRGSKSRRLTIYLLKEGREVVDQILTEHTRLIHREVRGIGNLYVRPSRAHPPAWADLFAGSVDFSTLSVDQANSAAILLVGAGGRMFALTFGHGKGFLEPGSWEERFGLLATLNSLDPKRLRSIEKRSFDAIARHSREQAARDVSADEFGLNVEQDMLRAATGKPTDATLGTRLTGMDALSITVKVELRDIPAMLERYLTQSRSEEYKQHYPWVDHIREVEDPELKEELDTALVESIQAGDDRVWMAVPEMIDWTDVAGFRYTPSQRNPLRDDIHVVDFLASLRGPERLTAQGLKQRKVYCFSESAEMITHQWPVYRCLYFEAERDGTTYLLTDGKWYAINRDFVAQINAEVMSVTASSANLPDYDDASEKEYNERVAGADTARFVLLDGKPIRHGGGQSSIEFCDLLTLGRDIIHVKRYGGSSVLSHLFAQGLVSGEAFHTDSGFRAKLNEVLPATHRLADPAQQPRASDYKVVFGVVSRDERPLRLPFFSKVNLRFAARRLQGFGYGVDRIKNVSAAARADEDRREE
ncbi:MAG: TIGR04141 family sporadically distributed protein [Candidatus Eisenbacteria bacterium]